ncbi:hypothetical protein L1987_60647 [Smallanthus sonchifolius]|uniref:Uncharacterized protein n=1 Tax=Smallanthus sonchifolius TaxID=185202 RepID=A0ACB9D913_9ASTR|nr:hypothetical protein L1987_60647 [Smallanthus sonchifolius]
MSPSLQKWISLAVGDEKVKSERKKKESDAAGGRWCRRGDGRGDGVRHIRLKTVTIRRQSGNSSEKQQRGNGNGVDGGAKWNGWMEK